MGTDPRQGSLPTGGKARREDWKEVSESCWELLGELPGAGRV